MSSPPQHHRITRSIGISMGTFLSLCRTMDAASGPCWAGDEHKAGNETNDMIWKSRLKTR